MVPKVRCHNWLEWPIPQPPDANLEHIRNQLLQAFGIGYFLVRCPLPSAKGKPEGEAICMHEWQIDVPTIGNVYRNAKSVFRYFNGLGLPVGTGLRA